MGDVLGPSLFRWDNAAGKNDAAQGVPQRRTSTKLKQEDCINNNDDNNVTAPSHRRNSQDKENTTTTTTAAATAVDALKSLSINRPSFLAAETVGPNRRPPGRRRPPARSRGFHGATTDLHLIPVKPIEFVGSSGGRAHMVQDGMARVLQDIVVRDANDGSKDDNNETVTIVFAIRVPGCGECREHGLQLTELSEKENVSVKGVIKETGVDDEALLEFYTEYFNFPLYKDEGMNLFNIIGNEKLDTFTLLAKAESMHKRVDAKGIRSSPQVKGEGLTQGGVLIFDKKGKLCYVYYETFGHEFDMEAINWAVDSLLKS